MVAIPKRRLAEVNGPQAWRVYLDARNVVPQSTLATIASMNPDPNEKVDAVAESEFFSVVGLRLEVTLVITSPNILFG